MESGQGHPSAAGGDDERSMGLYSLDTEPITCLACGGHLRMVLGQGVFHMDPAIDADHEVALPPAPPDDA